MKKKIFSTMLVIVMILCATFTLVGCGNSKKENTNAVLNTDTQTQENNIGNTVTNESSNDIELDARYTYSSDSVGIQIDLYSNSNKVVYEYIPRTGNLIENYGTYTIDGNKLTIEFTELDSLAKEEKWNKPIVYTIVSNKEFKDKDGNIYKYRTSLEKK